MNTSPDCCRRLHQEAARINRGRKKMYSTEWCGWNSTTKEEARDSQERYFRLESSI